MYVIGHRNKLYYRFRSPMVVKPTQQNVGHTGVVFIHNTDDCTDSKLASALTEVTGDDDDRTHCLC